MAHCSCKPMSDVAGEISTGDRRLIKELVIVVSLLFSKRLESEELQLLCYGREGA